MKRGRVRFVCVHATYTVLLYIYTCIIPVCISAAYFMSKYSHTRHLGEALWQAKRVKLINTICNLLTSPPNTVDSEFQNLISPQDSCIEVEQHQSLTMQCPHPPHSCSTTREISGPCEQRLFTALPANIKDISASHSSCKIPLPHSLSSPPQLRDSYGDYIPPLLPQQSRPPACSSTTAVTGASVQLQSYGSYLRSRYQAQVPSFALQWPPPPTRKIFNLAMIKKERVERGQIDEAFVRLTITGKVDDILHKKISVKLEEVFSIDKEKRKVILIEGAPGSGKSTLSWDICQRWGAGELFQEYEAVIQVQLRDPIVQSAKEIADLLPSRTNVMAQEVADEIVACDGKGVLWILDGMDEISPLLQSYSLVESLIRCNLHWSSVIVTSRPIASAVLQPLASSRIEIVGFTSAELRQYFSECLEGNCGAVKKLLEGIEENPMVEGSCYLPLNAAIIVHLFLVGNHTLPTTMHGIFLSLVLSCLSRYLKEDLQESHGQVLDSLENLPQKLQEPFKQLCTLANAGIMKHKVTFSPSDLKALHIPSEVIALGLLQAVPSIVSNQKTVYYSFLHLSVQELLAAFHISQQAVSEQISIFQELFGQPHFNTLFQFYTGLTKLQKERSILSWVRAFIPTSIPIGIRDVVKSMIQSDYTPLYVSLLNCLNEAQDLSLCQFVAKQLGGRLDLQSTSLTPLDCLSIGYFLSCVCVTTSGEFTVDLRACSVECRFLARGLCKHPARSSSITGWLSMDLEGNDIHESGVQYIANVLKSSSIVRKLILNFSTILEHGLQCIAQALLTNFSLTELYLRDCALKTSQESGQLLKQMLQRNKALRILDMSFNRSMSDAGVFFIAEGLKQNTILKELRLSECSISPEGAKFISGALIAATICLEVLNLGGNKLGDTGVGHIACALKQNNSLKVLSIWGCGMTDKGLKLLSHALTENKALQKLDITWNRISERGLLVFTEFLMKNEGLVKLWLQRHFRPASVQEAVNESRKKDGLPLIEVHCESDYI